MDLFTRKDGTSIHYSTLGEGISYRIDSYCT